jgi:EmrB/QacA subfamily drug resistance transporter
VRAWRRAKVDGPRRDARNRRLTLAATVGRCGDRAASHAAIVVALPTIHAEFDASIAELQWTVTAFYIPETAFLIAAGRIADIFGRRLMLLIGAALFAAGSVIAATAGGAEVLIAGIAVCGIGAALLMPASMSILTNVFTDARRGMAIGMWGAATELISGVGMVVGGVLTGALSWRWIFIVCAIVVGVVALAAWRGAPESHDPRALRKVDLPGVALLATALTALALGLIQGATWGWGSTAIVILLVAAMVLLVTFVVVERRTSQPIISFDFFRRRNFAGATIVIFAIDFSFGALLFFLPLYFQEVLGYSPVEAGVQLLPLTGLMVIGSPLGGRVAARAGPRPPIVVGLALMATAVFWISTLSLDTDYADLWLPTAMVGFGIGFSLTPMNLAAMNAVSPHHAGAASGMLVTLSGLGATLGVAATGALFNSLNTDRTATLATEAGVRVTEDQAQELDGVLAGAPGAHRALERIAGDGAPQVLRAVREAFVSALGTSLKLAAALAFAGLLLTVILMRRQDPVDEEDLPPPVGRPHTARLRVTRRSGSDGRALELRGELGVEEAEGELVVADEVDELLRL